MRKTYRIELNGLDLGKLLDGPEARADAWERTARYHRTGGSPPGYIAEECNDAEAADDIAGHYRAIITKIRKQEEVQS